MSGDKFQGIKSGDNSFEIKGQRFKLSKIDAMKQFHVVRKCGPILSNASPAMKQIHELEKSGGVNSLSESEKFDKMALVLTPFIEGIGKLSDQDSEMVLLSLLSAVEFYQLEFSLWAKVSDGKVLFMQNLSLPTLLQAAGRSFMFNLSGFFPEPLR